MLHALHMRSVIGKLVEEVVGDGKIDEKDLQLVTDFLSRQQEVWNQIMVVSTLMVSFTFGETHTPLSAQPGTDEKFGEELGTAYIVAISLAHLCFVATIMICGLLYAYSKLIYDLHDIVWLCVPHACAQLQPVPTLCHRACTIPPSRHAEPMRARACVCACMGQLHDSAAAAPSGDDDGRAHHLLCRGHDCRTARARADARRHAGQHVGLCDDRPRRLLPGPQAQHDGPVDGRRGAQAYHGAAVVVYRASSWLLRVGREKGARDTLPVSGQGEAERDRERQR